MRSAVDDVLHPHLAECRADAGERLLRRRAEVERAERDVLAHGRHEQLVVGVLEHEPDARPQLAGIAAPDVDPGHGQLTLAGQQTVEVQHQRGLAGAVRPEHRDTLAVAHAEVEPVEPGNAVGVAEAEPAGCDRAAHHITSIITRSGTSAAARAVRNSTSARANASARRRGAAPA
jgi:hypothetical protein